MVSVRRRVSWHPSVLLGPGVAIMPVRPDSPMVESSSGASWGRNGQSGRPRGSLRCWSLEGWITADCSGDRLYRSQLRGKPRARRTRFDCCLSWFHFACAFKAAVGRSHHQYVSAKRSRRARELPNQGDRPWSTSRLRPISHPKPTSRERFANDGMLARSVSARL